MNTTTLEILKQLSHETYIDGTTIGNALGITRAAVWKAIQKLQNDHDVAIESHRVHGYKLQSPLIMLDQAKILSRIKTKNVIVDCYPSIDSTNTYLQNTALKSDYHICMAEEQRQGKGRFDRVWRSPFAENLYYSLKVSLQKELSELSGLSLAVAVSVAKTFAHEYPMLDIKIKWPNDIYINAKKLSGILIEVKAESNAQSQIVIGIGVNVNMQQRDDITQDWTSLANELNQYIDRNELAINLSNELISSLQRFENNDFSVFIDEYTKYDYLKGKTIGLNILNKEVITGIANGVNALGQLKLKTGDSERVFSSGEASVIKKN
ncbi:biotin--[acetyl-CoA-carboxylase] ligase [Cysteiniphilum halobium]|uniref:biotin--[acetyl-CoA-carboxylase] ligase n=1 Tax=Cysteiniphilum halobium TaxID=2219059 RepID=UPI000E64C324|nr:biotin--[acetyl-CoA-carboxylase] ligase [Cysteiniphilum halobium]